MKWLKFITTRNPFSREYGTWLIIVFNLAFAPIVFQQINQPTILFSLSVFFFMLFRFELIDYYSIQIQHNKTDKIKASLLYLILAGILFYFIRLNLFLSISMGTLGLLTTLFNVLTRRKKGKRQSIFSQITLILFVAGLATFNYYLIFQKLDHFAFITLIVNALFYSSSVIFVRSKTVGAPYHIYALFAALVSIIILAIIAHKTHTQFIWLLFIPTLVKTIDNIVLENSKVHLRRIGINETIHSALFIAMAYIYINNIA